jgi:hypothetical protein
MLKRASTILIGFMFIGASAVMAEAPAEGNPSSTANIRNIREHIPTPPIPDTALSPQWWALAREVGWAEEDLETLDYVIYRESRGDSTAWNKQDPNGGSRCLVQVNGSWTGWLRRQNILLKPSDLFIPRICLTAGLAIHQYGMDRYGWGWGPWAIPAP